MRTEQNELFLGRNWTHVYHKRGMELTIAISHSQQDKSEEVNVLRDDVLL